MLSLLTIMLGFSIIANFVLIYLMLKNKTARKQARIENAQRSLVKGLKSQIDKLTQENTKLGAIIIEQNERIKALKASLKNANDDIVRLTKAAKFAGSVSNGLKSIGNGLKKVTVRNAGTAIGNVAGNTVASVFEAGKAIKDGTENVKGAYENKTQQYTHPTKIKAPTINAQVEDAVKELAKDKEETPQEIKQF